MQRVFITLISLIFIISGLIYFLTPNWSPMTLAHCLNSTVAGHITFFLCLVIFLSYMFVARIWWRTYKYSSEGAKSVWLKLIGIFVFCGFAGYGTWALSFFPILAKISAIIKIVSLSILSMVTPWFLWQTRNVDFIALGKQQKMGKEFSELDTEESDKELASKARILIKKYLEK